MDKTSKICRVCGKDTPLDQLARNKNCPFGVDALCKVCKREVDKRYAIDNKAEIREKHHSYYLLHRQDILDNVKGYRIAHQEEINERRRQYRQNNRDKIRIQKRQSNIRNIQHLRQYHRNYAKRNEQRSREYHRQYALDHPEKFRAAWNRRRARKLQLPNTYTERDWKRCLDYFGGCCAICGRPPGFWHTLAMDHWIPLDDPACPGTVPANIIPLCNGNNGCNQSKANSDPQKWLLEKFGKRKATRKLKEIATYFEWIKRHEK